MNHTSYDPWTVLRLNSPPLDEEPELYEHEFEARNWQIVMSADPTPRPLDPSTSRPTTHEPVVGVDEFAPRGSDRSGTPTVPPIGGRRRGGRSVVAPAVTFANVLSGSYPDAVTSTWNVPPG